MDCEIIRQNLTEYSRGRLNSSESSAVERHLEKCENCRAFLLEERAFDLRLAGMPKPEPKEDVWVMVRARTHRRPSAVERLFVNLAHPKRALAAAATLAAAVAAMLVMLPAEHQRNIRDEQVNQPGISQRIDSQTAQRWSDDPLGADTDQVLAAIEEAL